MIPSRRKVLGRYILGWVLLALLAIGNGVLRQATYGRLMPELAAHQVSTLSAMGLVAMATLAMHCAWPLRSPSEAARVGIAWLVMTVCFEFLFGHYVAGHSWTHLLQDYNLLGGRLWSLFLAWLALVPWLVYRLAGAWTERRHERVGTP